jgi:hypothetical protein
MKKLSLLLAVAAAFALAVPALASAHKVTSKAGVLAPVGTELTLTGSDPTWNSSVLGPLTCSSMTLKMKLTTNDGTNVTGSSSGEKPPTVGCENEGRPITTTQFTITRFAAEGTETNMSFIATIDVKAPSGETVECTFTGTNVPFTYTVGSSSIVFNKAGPIKGSAGCSTATLTATFAIEIGGTPVILD